MFDWYADMSRGGRIGIALLVLGVSGVAFLFGFFWPWGCAIGGVLLAAAFLIQD